MKVFLDTNVILDHALDREHCYASEATIILEWCASGMLKGFISSGSVYTLTYVLERAGYRGRGLRQKLQAYLSWVRPLASDEVMFRTAFGSEFADLEDAYQYFTALSAGPDFFVTGNLKNFASVIPDLAVPVLSPAEFVDRMSILDLPSR